MKIILKQNSNFQKKILKATNHKKVKNHLQPTTSFKRRAASGFTDLGGCMCFKKPNTNKYLLTTFNLNSSTFGTSTFKFSGFNKIKLASSLLIDNLKASGDKSGWGMDTVTFCGPKKSAR